METCRQGGEEKERAHQQTLQQLLEHRNQNLSMPGKKNKRLFLRKMKRGSQYPSCWSLPRKVLARSLRFDKYPRDKTRLTAGPKEEEPLREAEPPPEMGEKEREGRHTAEGHRDTQEHLSPCPSDCWSSRARWHGPAQIPVQSPLTPSSAAPGRSPHPHCRQPHGEQLPSRGALSHPSPIAALQEALPFHGKPGTHTEALLQACQPSSACSWCPAQR